ncbi:ASPIC/UnbV domain protein [Emticicia oligotrophica DSM 17448]|uniref:ASPIC/UnbV domain protein n=1 Tax=Emticicia oligotrophica (strain DSM 17448 / CIP 109782 / MTCC 6937 / GPTSA100-15) TaxID=929562 RepID=A0ABN4AKQ4_EMTOG|nr:VCBS repeat-containing protein [Emticicia oligotrophica]AFK02772.1 ASPIC/UnbV domain protein [Emticicia oligotrophica DSM 17448]
MKSIVKILSTITVISLVFSSCKSGNKENDVALFKKLSPTETKVDFTNQITESKDFNILDYLYFYNGGGVSAGDINNDGLTDLFFVSNQGKNKLYINKGVKDGVPQFEDISEKAGIGGFSDWKTGSTMVDINGDGLLDIYVCAVSNYKGLEGSNELYINNGDLTFTEKADEYGLDFAGFSTQAAFFDYDKDGDLDMYLLNHAVHNTRSYDRVNTRMLKDNEAGDYLYRNDNGKFTDVSKEAGIYQAAMGYGLGISVADINNDGWLDIYVSNDFHEDDYYYINQKNGKFSEEMKQHFKHLSRFSMGSDVADINNDGYQDIMTLDMYPEDEKVEKSSVGEDPLEIYLYKLQFGYFNQYSRNCLQLSMGGKKFSDIAPSAGVMATDWSWSTLMADYDGDGIKDIFITNGILRRPNDLDYLKFIASDSLHYNVPTSEKLDQEAIDKMPSGKWHNYLYKGTKELRFQDKSMVWGFEEEGISNGAAYADLDNDGDLDLISNNLNEPASIYLNNSRQLLQNNFVKVKFKGNDKNKFGVGAKVILKTSEGEQLQQMMPTRGFMSSVEPSLIFGIGKQTKVDTMIVIWENQKMEIIKNPTINTTLTVEESKAQINVSDFQFFVPAKPIFEEVSTETNIPFVHQENVYFDFNREFLIPFKVSVDGPKMAVGDANGDGLEDFYVGGAKYQAGALYLQKAGGGFSLSPQAVFQADSLQEDVDALFFDADGDKDQDLYVVSGGNEFYDKMPQQFDRLYINDGKGNFTKSTTALPEMYDNKSCVRPCDFDKDGDIDLFVGGRVVGYNYGKSPRSYLLVNNGKGKFTDITVNKAPDLREAGMITDAIWADLDKDGDQDLTVIGDWMPIKMFENNKGKFTEIDNKLSSYTGFWNGITAADYDKDGDIDLVIGNLGTNTKFRKEEGGQLKMLIKDIDGNDAKDHIIAYNRGSDWYPVNSKDEMGKQLPSIINKKYVEYKNFAGKTIDELFTSKELKDAEEKLVNTFESVYLENQGNNTFKMSYLPSLAQVSKVMSLVTEDVDNDGNLDVIVGGNFSGANMYQARYDAFFGLILKGNGKGQFTASVPTDNGLLMEGDVRDIKTLNTPKGKLYFVTRNNDKLQVFRKIPN